MNILINNIVVFFIGSENNKLSSLQLNNKLLDLYIPSISVIIHIARENNVITTNSRFNGFKIFIILLAYIPNISIIYDVRINGISILEYLDCFLVLILNIFIS